MPQLNALDQSKAVIHPIQQDTGQNQVENFYHSDQNLRCNSKLMEKELPYHYL